MSASYIPRTWRERLGTNLNKFLKSSETAASVILENAPGAITQSGTPFTADAMNNIEAGIENNYLVSLSALGLTPRNYYGICSDPSGNIYAAVYGGDIYKSTNGGTTFTALGLTPRNYYGICSDPSGNIYAAVYGGDIYKSTNGGATFTALGLTSRNYCGICSDPSGNVYVSDFGVSLYKSTNGGTSFTAVNAGAGWGVYGIASDDSGNIYFGAYSQNIYKSTDGGNTAEVFADVKAPWGGLAVVSGLLFATGGGDIYKTSYSPITPASIFPVTVTTADATVTENRFQTIRFSGALTGNRVVTMLADVRQYKLICDCTGSYYIHVKTASGTGVYLAPGDVAEVYCDGVNIVKLPGWGKLHTISAARSSVKAITGAHTPITDWTITNNYLGQQGARYFTALQACVVTVHVSAATESGTAGGEFMALPYVNDSVVFAMRTTIDGSYGASLSGSYRVALAAGDKLDVRFASTTATNLTATSYLRLVVE